MFAHSLFFFKPEIEVQVSVAQPLLTETQLHNRFEQALKYWLQDQR